MEEKLVTENALETRLKIEREATKAMIYDEVRSQILPVREIAQEAQREAMAAAAGYRMVKDFIQEMVDGLSKTTGERFDRLEKMIETHDAPIRRLRAYETFAVAGVNVIGSLPFLKWLKRALSFFLAVGGGVFIGMVLFSVVAR
jgi:hypothetical protein